MTTTPDHDESDALAISAQDEYYHNARERSIDDDMMEEYSEKPPPPPKKKFYKNKKYWIICSILSIIIIVVVVCLIVFVFFPMIVQSLMNQAGIDVNGADISFSPPQTGQPVKRDYDIQNTFFMNMQSTLKNTGPFSADIVFHNPIMVYYNGTRLGNITLPGTSIGGGHGDLNAQTPFLIEDPNYFALFSKDMLAMDSFDWNLKGSCDVTALSRTSTASLDKTVTIPGMGGFKDVKIQSFQLPANDPNGGIIVELGTVMVSPSPVGVQLGTIQLQIGYQGVNLGKVSATNVTLQKGDNTIPLKGTLQPQTNPADLEKVGVMFSTYVSGGVAQTSATGVSAAPDGHTPVNWLTQAFQSVQLNVGLANQGGPLKIINAVSMGFLDLTFDANNPYAPTVSAPNVVADFSIPFGFSLNITDVTQNITMNTNSTGNFSDLAVPWVSCQSDQKAGKLQFPINGAALTALPGKDDAFNSYTYDLTSSDKYTFGVSGVATTRTKTPIGEILLGGISFAVPTSLHGLQFLNSTPTVITGVDMTGGTQKALQLNINVTMGNPSDFSMSVGDVTFAMFAGSTQVGTVTLANLTLQRGDNKVVAQANFDPKSSSDGQKMLSTFVMGQDNLASIGGYDGSTPIASLAKALSAIKIDTTLPGLKAPLIQSGALKVLPDTVKTSIVNVAVTIGNPFTAGLAITKVKSAATYKGMPVGNIDQDISNNPFVINGHANGVSPQLNMQMNLQPAAVALLMRDLAVDAHLDTKALDGLLGMGGFHIQGQQDVAPEASIFKGFNISSYVLEAMKVLKVDLNLESGLQVGDYTDDLAFSQSGVQIHADDSVTQLIPIVGQPIVQQIVNGAVLGFDTLILSNPTDNNAKVQMKGSITKSGPMDATISFPSPLTVRWQGKTLGTATMPDIQALADKGAQFDVPSNFIITDQQAMQDFAAYMINNEQFVWDIVATDVSVTALGFTFTGVKMEKFVTIKGANGFKGAVTINSFNLPSNDPDGGITLVADTTIVNPSQVGFNLNTVAFNSYYQDILVGPLAASPGNFAPGGPSKIQMKGRMIAQNTQHGLDMVTKVFEAYLNASDSVLSVKGDLASGPTGPVGWLTQAFKTLKIDNVVLPGPKEKPVLIPSITMENMQLDFTKDPYAAPASSSDVRAQLKNPFGFPLGVSQLNMEVDAEVEHNKMAHLSVPTEKATTDSNQMVKTQFDNVPFKVYDNAHSDFSGFVLGLTKSGNASFGLAGTSNALTDTAVGKLQLNGIGFDVTTSLAGFNNFGGKADIVSLSITGGTKEYTLVKTVVGLTNPSQITITIGDVNFSSKTSDGSVIGQVFIKNTVIKPGVNQYDAEFHLAGDTTAIGQLFSDYLTNVQVPLSIVGTSSSTTIEPLQNALESVHLDTTMKGIQANLVVGVKVIISIADLLAQKAKTVVTLRNPLDTSYALTDIKADVFFPDSSGTFKVGHVTSIPSACSVPAGGQTTCDEWSVDLDANLVQLLKVLLAKDKSLNLQQNITTTVGPSDGYEAKFYYYQDKVPTELDFDLGILDLPLSPKLNSTESAHNATSTDSKSSTTVKSSDSATDKPTSTDNNKPTETSSKSEDKPTDTSDGKTTPTEAPKTKNDDDSSKSDSSSTTSSKGGHFIFPF
ncbi:hypothetical protein BC941DRAFT_516864 [Chlamydoabsidia padenii]|nr:hypothetical protein BC941DRAFT_516864 [Chlamydoabsidia padenii]